MPRPPPDRPNSPLWAITCHFNPVRYESRLKNYRVFRQNLGVPLVAVELSFDGNFELCSDDAEILVQLRGGDVMWQKERLLNVALRSVPAECEKIAWVDSDVLFDHDRWADRACKALDHFAVVQLFKHIYHLPRGHTVRPARRTDSEFGEESLLSRVTQGRADDGDFRTVRQRQQATCSRGVAWAYRRDVLDRHGLYDGCILGGADTVMACAAFGRFDDAVRSHRMNERQTEFFLSWAREYFASVQGRVSVVDCDVFHLWHGRMKDRRYLERHESLRPFDFDPRRDIAKTDTGAWCWNTEKPELQEYVRQYFLSRNEDL